MRWAAARDWLGVPAAVILGLALRSYHYLRCPDVWHDEAALIVNVLGLSFSRMLGPLIHSEAAPPLFLMAERAIVLGLGDGEYALRLLPFAASCLSMLLFAGLAWRMLGPLSAALAVGLFAVSDRLLWHSCEAKPYAVDVLVAVAAAYWFIRTAGWPLAKRCLPAATLAPVAIWMSFPACFVAGGLLVALVPAAIRSGGTGRAAYLALAATVGVSFFSLALGPVAAQRSVAMDGCWTAHFPDWSRPWSVPIWSVVQTLEVARYCLYPAGQFLAPLTIIGAWVIGRRSGGKELLAAVLLPLGLALIASLLHKYPYGGTRVEVFATPAFCLLTAAGCRHAIPLLAQRSQASAVLLALTLLPPFVLAPYRVIAPWLRAECAAASRYVLTQRNTAEPILVNHWEYQYYFREQPGWRMWSGVFAPDDLSTKGVWVVHTGVQAVDRFPFPLPPGWAVTNRREFRQTTVFRLQRTH